MDKAEAVSNICAKKYTEGVALEGCSKYIDFFDNAYRKEYSQVECEK